MPVRIQSIKFWINAFIPREVPGYTRRVPGGPHAGKTMIPGPQNLQFRRQQVGAAAPSDSTLVGVSDCYLTDQRGFSNDIHAKSRLHSEFRIDFTGRTPSLVQWHNCDATTECDCEDGDVESTGKGSTTRCLFRLLLPSSQAAMAAGIVSVHARCAASNPCAPSSHVFGDIDFDGYVHIDVSQRRIETDLRLDAFPAFEAYATINDGAGVPLFCEMPPQGNSVMNLPGAATRSMRRRMDDRNGDGIFEAATPR